MTDHLPEALDAPGAAWPSPPPAELARLGAALARRAEADGVLDVTWRTLDSPIGPLLVAATEAGLVRLAFEREGHDAVLEELATRVSPRLLPGGSRTDAVATQLEEYFAGRRRRFDLAVDLRLVQGFRREVVAALASIGYGATATYAEVARATGRPAAVRAVGTACSRNPVPVVLPCHRVVRSDGRIGEYLGGTEAKRTLLALESA